MIKHLKFDNENDFKPAFGQTAVATAGENVLIIGKDIITPFFTFNRSN